MKILKSFVIVFFLCVLISSVYAQGKKYQPTWYMEWNQSVVPISCIGEYSGVIEMQMTFFESGISFMGGKVMNKASGEITDHDTQKQYTIKSIFNCNLFSARTSTSDLSVQSHTFRVRCKETGKLVATVHATYHFDNNGDPGGTPSFANITSVCH